MDGMFLPFIRRQICGFENYDCQNTPDRYEKTHIVYNVFVGKVCCKCYIYRWMENRADQNASSWRVEQPA